MGRMKKYAHYHISIDTFYRSSRINFYRGSRNNCRRNCWQVIVIGMRKTSVRTEG